jgi:hypothetical protein
LGGLIVAPRPRNKEGFVPVEFSGADTVLFSGKPSALSSSVGNFVIESADRHRAGRACTSSK